MPKHAVTVAIGVATGLLAGLLGVGGGLVMVPGMTQLLKMRQHEAVGTSLLVIIPIALVGALVLGQSHDVDPLVGVILAVASIVGAVVGAGLTRTISDRTLRRVFAIAVLVVAVVMLIDAGATMLHAGIGLHPGSRPSGALLVVLGLAIGLVTGVLSGLLGIAAAWSWSRPWCSSWGCPNTWPRAPRCSSSSPPPRQARSATSGWGTSARQSRGGSPSAASPGPSPAPCSPCWYQTKRSASCSRCSCFTPGVGCTGSAGPQP
ncbi:MAG TPA: sulfite exporter TauE/SafE family protein [Candidatus Eisenbacteria bacterium]|nr:sulfite exporter TauE/SafE family protein [Candidatus Eisenbacteria bacterium]